MVTIKVVSLAHIVKTSGKGKVYSTRLVEKTLFMTFLSAWTFFFRV